MPTMPAPHPRSFTFPHGQPNERPKPHAAFDANVPEGVDPEAQWRTANSGKFQRTGSTAAQRAGQDPNYVPGYGTSAAQNRPTGTTPGPEWDAQFQPQIQIPQSTRSPGQVPSIPNPPAPHGLETSTGPTMKTVSFAGVPASKVIPASANATDAQRTASIGANMAQNTALYQPGGATAPVTPPRREGFESTTPNQTALIAANYGGNTQNPTAKVKPPKRPPVDPFS